MKKDNTILIIALVVLGLLLLGSFGFGGMMSSSNLGYGMMSGFGGMWIFGWLFMILIVVALILFIVWLAKEIQKK